MPASRAGDPRTEALALFGPTSIIPPSPWIHTADALARLARALGASPEIALDTEGDSLHHYPERLSLIQIADSAGVAALVDPLALGDLSPLAPVFANPGIVTVLHAGGNDLDHLKRRYGFRFAEIFDTSIAARFLGARSLGLDVLVTEHLGVTLPPSRQKDDWSARPLSPAQQAYAVADVAYLGALKVRLVERLREAGRLAWVEEECAALAAEAPAERLVDPDAYARIRGAAHLSPRALAVLHELFDLRERLALQHDRPPFKILGDDTLVRLAAAEPTDAESLLRTQGCTPRVVGRWGESLLAAIARGRNASIPDRPSAPRSRPPAVPAAVRRRIEALRRWREEAAPRLGLEPGVLLPNRLIRAIAESGPRDREDLGRVEGLRRWRVGVLGDEILKALAGGAR